MYGPYRVQSVLTTSAKILPYRPLARLIRAQLRRASRLWPTTVQELNKEGLSYAKKLTSCFKLIESKLYLAKNLERPFSVVLHAAVIPRVCPRKASDLNRWQISGAKCYSHDSLAVVRMHNLIVKKKGFSVVNKTY